MADGYPSNFNFPRIIPGLKVSVGGLTGPYGSSAGPPIITGISKETVEGDPDPPCIRLQYPGYWGFYQAVSAGAQTLSIYCKQAANLAPYPSLIVKANAAIGIAADLESSAADGVDWKQITQAIAPASDGLVRIELHNNLAYFESPCFFDNFSIT